jgi:uncharacterized protein (TIGR03437 family)
MAKYLSQLGLLCGVAAGCFGQGSYTATLLRFSVPYDLVGLSWISDDGRTGFGYGYTVSPFVEQCFTYQDGNVTIIPTPGFDCQPEAANAGIFLMRLNPPVTTSVTYSLAVYANGKVTPIILPDGVSLHSAPGINKKGQIAGEFACPAPGSSISCAYLISSDGTFTRLPDLGGYSGATAINDDGDVVGYVVAPGDNTQSARHAVLWPHTGGMKDLGSLTTMKLGTPVAINQRGQIAGRSPFGLVAPVGSGFFYDGAGTFNPIQPNGASAVSPISLNDRGEVIGTYVSSAGNGLAAPFYFFNGAARDLNSALVNLPSNLFLNGPVYINNAGQMLVSAVPAQQPAGAVANGTAGKQYLVSPSNASVIPIIGSVLNGASYLPGVASSAWIKILGQNLSTTSRVWSLADIVGNKLPVSLDGVSVTINGLPAYVSEVSPTRISVLAPDDPSTGPVLVQVTNAQGASTPFSVTKSEVMPALLTDQMAPTGLNTSGTVTAGTVTATHADGTPVCFTSAYGCRGTPAVSGETISLFGTGFGATKTPAAAGETVPAPVELANPVTVTIGGKPATVRYAARVSSGLDQINVIVPDSIPHDNESVTATVKGVSTPGYLYLAIGN